MLYLLIFITTFTLALVSTPFAIEKLVKLDIVDRPGGRKLHSTNIPRMGGIIIYIISVTSFLFYSTNLYYVTLLILPSLILVICGILDDIRNITWRTKFLFQTLTAVGLVSFLSNYLTSVQLFGINFPQPYSYIVLTVFIIGVINSVNLMDGMDGLVSGFSLVVFIVIFGLAFGTNNTILLVLTASLAGSTLGFTKYNYYPAKIFLGDTGSLTLGFFLVLSSILLSLNNTTGSIDLTFTVILFGLPVLDTLKVMVVRIIKKKNPFLADRNHLHHIIVGSHVNHKTTVFIIHCFTLLFIFTAIYYFKASAAAAKLSFVILALMLLSIKRLLIILRGSIIHRSYIYLRDNAPQFITSFYKKFFVPVSIILLSILFFFLIPGKTEIRHQVILMMIIGSVVLFLIFLSQNFRSKLFNDVYVLINIAVFFSVTNLSRPLFATLNLDYNIIKNTVLVSLSILVLLLLIFLMVREKLFNTKISFLSKYDFIILAIVSLIVLFQDFARYPKFYSISGKFIVGFIAYLIYKVITHFNKELSRWFLYLTFMVTLITFIFMYVD